MVEYELFYAVGESKDAELMRIREDVEKLVVSFGGVFLAPQTEEKRKFAYPVKKEIRGTYIARRFTLPDKDEQDVTGVIPETHPLVSINKALLLSKDVPRFLILSADSLPELKAIPREERPRTENRGNRYEKRGAVRPMPAPIVQPQETEKKAVSTEQIDEQLKAKLDI
jgi:ribosomal protein S6